MGIAHDDDIYAWSMEQAALLRDLAGAPGFPRELDFANLADEVEDVGKSELHRVESFVRLILVHLLKIASAPGARAADHWRREVRVFGAELAASVTRSIAAKLDMDRRWRIALDVAGGDLATDGDRLLPGLPETCPIPLADLLVEPLDVESLDERLRVAAR